MNFDYMEREDLIAAVCRLEAEADRQPEPAEQVVARTWSSVPPTVDGLYWWRLSKRCTPRGYNVLNGYITFPFNSIMMTSSIGGEWLPVTLPGPENEPGATS